MACLALVRHQQLEASRASSRREVIACLALVRRTMMWPASMPHLDDELVDFVDFDDLDCDNLQEQVADGHWMAAQQTALELEDDHACRRFGREGPETQVTAIPPSDPERDTDAAACVDPADAASAVC